MPRSAPVDGFSLHYDRHGAGPPVVLLHGWPGDRRDYSLLVERLAGEAELIVPDLRGFGESDKHARDPREAYSGAAQAASVAGLLDELGVERPVIAGYDVGSRVAQQLAADAPGRLRALVIAPPVPGAGDRILGPDPMREFWYQFFHQTALPEGVIDGRPEAVRAYLEHFWSHWSGPAFTPSDALLDGLTERYAPPGAFVASIGWYRAGAGMVARSLSEQLPMPKDRLAVPTTVLWPEHNPIFPRAWSDRLRDFFADVTLRDVPDCGHYVPIEAPDAFADAIRAALSA